MLSVATGGARMLTGLALVSLGVCVHVCGDSSALLIRLLAPCRYRRSNFENECLMSCVSGGLGMCHAWWV